MRTRASLKRADVRARGPVVGCPLVAEPLKVLVAEPSTLVATFATFDGTGTVRHSLPLADIE
jgi:hypothetical protein